MNTYFRRRHVVRAGAGLVLIVGALVVFLIRPRPRSQGRRCGKGACGGSSGRHRRQNDCPAQDKNFYMTVERPADVEAYYRDSIEARVAGEVKMIRVAPGSWVEKDQALVELAVPDLQAAEKEKASIIRQRERELRLAQAKTEAARMAVKTARANVEVKKTLLTQAKAETSYRQEQFGRLDSLWRGRAIDKNVRDEAEKNLKVSEAAEVAAEASRLKAESEVEDASANVSVMEAEVERRRELIDVARGDHNVAQALVDYATVKAPFRGTVVSRHVNPGSFVKNASTAQSMAVVTMERTDIMTVAMRVPDNAAPCGLCRDRGHHPA